MDTYNIFLADDHKILRDGIKSILSGIEEYKVIGESGSGEDALKQILKIRPDLVILDISMPELTGLEILRQVKKYYPEIRIIILSRHDSYEYIKKALKFGANGYILKDSAAEDLVRCVEEVIKGYKYISPKVATHLIDELNNTTGSVRNKEIMTTLDILTNREMQILKLIGEGKTTREISESLILSFATVRTHRANMMKKLNLHKVTEIVKFASKEGLLDR